MVLRSLGIEMPYRAEDAAVVPVTLRKQARAHRRTPPGCRSRSSSTRIPRPMAAKFELGKGRPGFRNLDPRAPSTIIPTFHAVAELSDGQLYVTKIYVKASGGCSAPAAKNPDEANNRIGQNALPANSQRAEAGSDQRRPRSPDHDRPSQ